MLLPVPWSPPLVELDAVPTEPADHPLTLFMEDTAWPHDGMLDDYLEAARTHYAPSLVESRQGGRAILELLAVFQTAWGAGRRSEVVLWQRILENARLQRLLETEVPPRVPGARHVDARRARVARPMAQPTPANGGLVTVRVKPRGPIPECEVIRQLAL